MPHKCPDFVTFALGSFASVFGMLARWYENSLFGKRFSFWVFARGCSCQSISQTWCDDDEIFLDDHDILNNVDFCGIGAVAG